MRRNAVGAALLLLSLNIVATVFTLLATTNKDWSSQAYYYDADGSDLGMADVKPICTLHRSPFYRCGIPEIANNACHIPHCTWYAPSGRNKTSCRSAAERGVDWTEVSPTHGVLGRRTECQEVHYAGNLQIAAATFITMGLILAMATLALSSLAHPKRSTHSEDVVSEGKDQDPSGTPPSTSAKQTRRSMRSLSSILAGTLLACLCIGALLQLLAQYFGVLGLTVNATPRFDGAVAAQKNTTLAHYVADDWAIGKGLSTYATVAWTFAVASAVAATAVFRTPRFSKLF